MTLSNFFKKLFSPIVVGNCFGVMAGTLLLVFAALYFLQCYTDHGDTVEVPNMRGQKLDVVRKKMAALGLRVEVADTGYVDTYVGDVVLEQSIPPGNRVKPGRIIDLTINAAGARAITVPLLSDNCSRREAEAKLRALGFRNIRVEYTPGDQDWVYGVKANGKTITARIRLPVTALITLVIGDGVVNETFNGNDSLDQELFPGVDDSEELIEDGGGEGYGQEPTDTQTEE